MKIDALHEMEIPEALYEKAAAVAEFFTEVENDEHLVLSTPVVFLGIDGVLEYRPRFDTLVLWINDTRPCPAKMSILKTEGVDAAVRDAFVRAM